MKLFYKFVLLILPFSLVVLLACESVDNGGDKDYVEVQVTVEQSEEDDTALQSYTASSVESAAIFAVPASVTLDTLDQIKKAYDGQLQDLVDGTVTLTVPLNESLKLVKFAYSTAYTLDQIIKDDQSAYAFGISEAFTVTGADEEKTINIAMMTGAAWGGTVQFGTANSFEAPIDMELDSQGNIFIVGPAKGDLDGNSNPAPGTDEVFITKFDSGGSKLWTKMFGSIGNDNPEDLIIDGSDNLLIPGSAAASIDGEAHVGGYDVFLAKFDNSGNKVFTKLYGNAGTDGAESVMIASNGVIYMVGSINGSWSGYTGSGYDDLFIMNVNSDGSFIAVVEQTSSTNAGNPEVTEDKPEHAIMDSNNNIYVTGSTFGHFGESNLGGRDAFIHKYDSGGTALWQKHIGTTAGETGARLTIDSEGNVYVVGATSGTISGQTSAGGNDYFLGKFNPADGTQIWITQFGSSADESDVWDLIAHTDGFIYFLGSTSGDFGGAQNTDPANVTDDIILVKFNKSTGAVEAVKEFGSIETDWATAMVFDSSGNLILTGISEGSMDGISTADPSGDIFLLKLDSNFELVTN